MNLIQKAALFYKREGLKNTASRVASKAAETVLRLPNQAKERFNKEAYLEQIRAAACGKEVYILISCIDWNIPLFQRPHQLAQALSRRENTQVFFVSDGYKYDNFPGILHAMPNLDVVSLKLAETMGEALKGANRVTIFMSWPRRAYLLEKLPYDRLMYEYVDDLSLFYYYTDELKAKHYDLIRQADLTVCTAQALYEDARKYSDRVQLSQNAGDYAFFHDNRDCPVLPELAEKTKGYDCVLGYYGCLASWFDYDLILEVAKAKPNWCFALVGYCFDGTVSRLQEANQENIILFPAQPYTKLPPFVAGFDIQTIPFCINEITRATNPVKLYEYMASGKPILTSKIPECLQYGSVTTYEGAEDFIAQAQQLLEKREDPEYLALMDAEARANTWDARVDAILEYLETR